MHWVTDFIRTICCVPLPIAIVNNSYNNSLRLPRVHFLNVIDVILFWSTKRIIIRIHSMLYDCRWAGLHIRFSWGRVSWDMDRFPPIPNNQNAFIVNCYRYRISFKNAIETIVQSNLLPFKLKLLTKLYKEGSLARLIKESLGRSN